MTTMQPKNSDFVENLVSKEMSRISRGLKRRLVTFQIEENYLTQSRIVSTTSLKNALQKAPRLSISTMISLENATGGSLYLKFVPARANRSTFCLKLSNPARDKLALVFASFFGPLLHGKDPRELSRRSGLSITTIKNLQNESHLPNLKTVFKMAHALGYDTYLLTMEKSLIRLK